jgi:hypothetical protein
MCGAGSVLGATYLYGLQETSLGHREVVLPDVEQEKDMCSGAEFHPLDENSAQPRIESESV